MTEHFDMWLHDVAPVDDLDPGIPVAGAEQFLRDAFDRLGAISPRELQAEGLRVQMGLAQGAVALVLSDLHATTRARPVVEVRLDDEYGVVIAYNGGWTTPAFVSMRNPAATSEIADYLQGAIMEDADVWAAWPTCPTHPYGLHAEVHDEVAVWHCRAGQHSVAAIGGHLTA